MKTAVITLCPEGLVLARKIAEVMPDCDLFVHEQVEERLGAETFMRVFDLTKEIFWSYKGLVYIMPTGVITRAISPMLKHKLEDPAVVAVDVGGRWAVSLLSGHEGGANILAAEVGNVLDADPVISTTTEAVKNIIAGVGCRRGTSSEKIIFALQQATEKAGVRMQDIRIITSADIKSDEVGLIEAAKKLEIQLTFIGSDRIRNCPLAFEQSDFVKSKVNLPAVAEPTALLAGRRTTLILSKQKYQDVTVALAVENFMW